MNTNLNVSTERRNSLSKEDQKKNDARRQSMLAVTDIKKMQKMDSRKGSVADQGGKKSRRGTLLMKLSNHADHYSGSFAAAAKGVAAMNKFKI